MSSIKVKFRPSVNDGKEGTIYYQIIKNRVIRQLKTDYRLFLWYPCKWLGVEILELFVEKYGGVQDCIAEDFTSCKALMPAICKLGSWAVVLNWTNTEALK